ncbi:MAG: hypothetical protein M3387_12480 [Actinomycetota bacterium]|nr:hypothetical protein [Actinomycetota bacterium]
MLPRPDDRDITTAPTVQEGMRAWRAAHPRATFAEIEVEATQQVAALRAELIRTALEAGEPETAPVCTACARVMERAGTRVRTITTSHQEQVTVQGQRYRCPGCGTELFPPG